MCGFLLAPVHSISDPDFALSTIRHRGADEKEGYAVHNGWFLGHTRLAVASGNDEGAQPFIASFPGTVQNPGRASVIAFVGEIFPDNSVVDEGDRGIPPGVYPEFELIRAGVNSPGYRDFHKYDGFWSVIQLRSDFEGGAEVLTDHLGIKPIYHWPARGMVCSELEPMFQIAGGAPPLNETYLANCIKFGYDYSGATPYQGVFQLPPGSVTIVNPHSPTEGPPPVPSVTFPYWRWDRVPRIHSRELVEEFHASVRARVENSRHPVGLLLSGGFDSSAIYYSLKEQGLRDRVEVFSIENGETETLPNDPNITLLPAPQNPSLNQMLYHLQAPMDLGSSLPQVALARALAGRGCRAVLTGDGADELFGGYRRAMEYDSQASDVFCELPYYHLPRLDRVMMRKALEVRSPFLAPRIAAYALEMPWSQRQNKNGLREAFRGFLPQAVIERPKVPLKSKQVLSGGIQYRRELVSLFRNRRPNYGYQYPNANIPLQ